jgi:hypothetical protein
VTKTGRAALFLFALAFFVRLAFGAWTDLTRPAVEDERGYEDIARSVFRGSGIELRRLPEDATVAELHAFLGGRWRPLPRFGRRSFRGPIVPLVFAPVSKVAGIGGMRLLAVLLGALGPPLLFLALRNSPLGERAWWPAAAYALWPPHIYVSVRALSEAPSQALLLGGLACLALPRTKGGLLAGVLGALSVLARPSALIPAGLLIVATGSRRRATWFLVAFLAVLAPWQIRNYLLHGRVLMTTNSGVTLVGGNSQAAADAPHPGKWVGPEKVYADAADPPDLGMWGWSSLSEEASDRRFTQDALKWIGEHPGDAAVLCFWKVVRLFDPDPHSGKDDAAGKALVGWLTFAPVLLLALLGASRWRDELPWTLLVVGTVATAVIFYGDTRMRTCADPALLVFAAHGALRVLRSRGETPV